MTSLEQTNYQLIADLDGIILKLRAELAERDEEHRCIMSEPCAPDEHHCTCVPALRAEIKRLRTENEQSQEVIIKSMEANAAAATLINEQQAEIERLRRAVQQ